MTKRLYSFQCSSCDNSFDELTEYTITLKCPQCGGIATKIVNSVNVKLEGITGAFPGAYFAWEKKHKQKLDQERKAAAA